ncbi:MAG: HNH endonuclease [Beijerinckiaceae bacterium]
MTVFTAQFLRSVLRYEPETGRLYWLHRPVSMFRDGKKTALHNATNWNARFSGKEAFAALSNEGYRCGMMDGHHVRAHRVIWAMQTGEWPEKLVDHIDGDKANNVWRNLRAATKAENGRNRQPSRSGSSKFLGVHLYKTRSKWAAQIKANGKIKALGYFRCETAAALAYNKAAMLHHGEFARLNFVRAA